jgi:hypothetical protein
VRQQASAYVVRLSGFVNLKLLSDTPVAGLRGDLTVTTEVLTSVDQPDLPIGFRMVLGAVGTVTLLGNDLPKANVRWIYSAGALGPDGSFAESLTVEMGLGETPSLGGKLNLPSWFPFDIRKLDINAKTGVLTLSGAINQLGIPGFNVSGVCENLRLDLNNNFRILGWDALGLGFELSLPGFGYLKAEGLFGLMKFDAAHNRIVDGDTTTPVAESVMYLGFSVDVRNDVLTMVGPFALATAALAKAGSPLAPIMGGLTLALGPLLPIQGLGIKVRMALSDYGLLSINLGFSLSMLPVYGEFEGQVTFYRTLPSLTSPIQLKDPSLRFNPPLGDWLTEIQGQLQQQEFVEHQSGPGRLQLGLIFRPVNLTQGNGTIHQPKCIPQTLGQGVRPGRHGRQHARNGLTKLIGRQPLGEGINRGKSANAIRSHRTGGSLQHFNQGITETGAAGSILDEAADGHRGPGGIQPLLGVQPTRRGIAPSSKKTRDPQPTSAVLDVEFVDGKIRILRAAEGMAATHAGHNRGGAPAFQSTDPHQIRVIQVIAGIVANQIPHQQQPQTRQP